MVIFGVALLSICMLLGLILGDMFGAMLGINANIGGVGLAMVILVIIVDYLTKRDKLSVPAQSGIQFWSAMYIPIVVAMAANQNVAGAIEGGPLALLAGLAATFGGWALVPLLSRTQNEDSLIVQESEKDIIARGESHVRNVK